MVSTSKYEKLEVPRDYYDRFVSRLRGLLDRDPSFKAKYLAMEIESKTNDPAKAESADLRRTRAIEKWLACEERNRATNVRLMHHHEEDILFLYRDRYPVSVVEVLTTARRFIADVVGARIPWDELSGSFSGGAATSVKRGVGTIARKFLNGTNITESAIWHFLRLTKESAVWMPRSFTTIPGNVLFTVPKTSLIDRCAAKEPDYNMYLQKAIGDYLRRRLKRVGVDLNDQSINQRLAKEGSIYASNRTRAHAWATVSQSDPVTIQQQGLDLATVDLSSASDSITTQLVLLLLPEEWFDLMDDVRSKFTYVNNDWHRNEMFSSMGNAFTFELESLIFWALTRACAFHTQTRGRISVYGDDIICPTGLEDALKSTFEYCGFQINPKKSFFEGPFRESCGKHWYNGVDVTPFYVKGVPVNVSDWILLLNSLRRWSHSGGGIADPAYYRLWAEYAHYLVPEPVKGFWSCDSRAMLASPGRPPIARVVRKQRTHDAEERALAFGAYLHWLHASDGRDGQTELETSRFKTDGPLTIRRVSWLDRGELAYWFPQELGLVD